MQTRPSPAPASTTVLILVGGQGTRLWSITQGAPKPVAAINSQPFLLLLIQYLISQDFTDIVLCTGYRSDVIEQHALSWQLPKEIKLAISKEHEPLGTAGAIRNAIRHIKSDPFIVLNGDTFIDLKYQKFLGSFNRLNTVALLALTSAIDRAASGSVIMDAQNRIISFREKDSSAQAASHINAGAYLFSRHLLDVIDAAGKTSLERDSLPRLLDRFPDRVFGFTWPGDFIDIGTPANYHKAQRLLQKYQEPVQHAP